MSDRSPTKQYSNRFTLQFNDNDPHHRKAVEILNQQGKRKSSFIADAILHYVACTKQPMDQASNDLDIEKLIISVVARTLAETEQRRTAPPPAVDTPPPKRAAAVPDTTKQASSLSSSGKKILGEGLSAFRK